MSYETNAQHIHRTHFSERPRSSDFARIEPQRHAPVCVEEDKGVEREVRLRFAHGLPALV